MKVKISILLFSVLLFIGSLDAYAQTRPERRPSGHSGANQQNGDDTAEKEEPETDETPVVKLGVIPQIDLPNRLPATPRESEKIEALIERLAAIENPDFGFATTFTGSAFAPIPGIQRPGAMVLSENDRRIDHNRQESDAFRELVVLGPKSIPFLLKALDDKSPTKLTMTHTSSFGAMWRANELSGNPLNKTETAVLAEKTKLRSNLVDRRIETYTVKVGDVCFVALGQIVGRPYSTVRFQPTACVVINSPADDAKLCSQVRDIWASDDSNKKLFESLLLDYSTYGIFNGENLDGWSVGSSFQCGAAMRLLFYYPETEEMIAERLRQAIRN